MSLIDGEFAERLCSCLGGPDSAPNLSRFLASAERICRKRARAGDQARSVVATRGDILFSTDTAEFRAPSVQGLQLLDRFERFLERVDELYMSRSVSQRDFHQNFTIACLPHIVGAHEWEKHRTVFLDRFKQQEFKAEVMVTTPRRFGKTTGVF